MHEWSHVRMYLHLQHYLVQSPLLSWYESLIISRGIMESLFETITSIDGLIAELNRVQPSYFFGFDFDTDLF